MKAAEQAQQTIKEKEGSNPSNPIDEMYPLPWSEEINVAMNKTLVANKIRGCGQLKHRVAKGSRSEYLVGCTRDGENWRYYLVFTVSGDVTGPLSDKIE